MTDPTPAPQDRDAVEALAASHDKGLCCGEDPCRLMTPDSCMCARTAATLRALLAERDKRAHEADVLRRVLTVAERGGDGPDVELAQECAILTGALMRSDAEIAALTARATAAEAQAAAAREGALREAEALARDFDWVLPLYVDKAVNEATDDAAEEVARQIADAIAALAPTAPEGDVPTRGLLQVPHE